MMSLYRKNELLFAILCIVTYVVVAGNLRTIGDDSPAMAVGLAVLATILLWFVFKNNLGKKLDLCAWPSNVSQMLYLLPLWLITTGNLWGGFQPNYQGIGLVCAVVSFALVGVVEEILFRGFLFHAMLKDGKPSTAIIISSVTFGMGHIVNLLTGHGTFETLTQMVFAVAVGFILTMVVYKGGSLLPVIVAHSLIDVFSVFARDVALAHWAYIIVCIATAVLYGIYLTRVETPHVEE